MIGRVAFACLLALAAVRTASAETLAALVSREQGVDFGPCVLAPPPDVKGEAVHAVIPARFEHPGIWITRTLLLVGVDGSGTVQGQMELRLAADVPPREVLRVRCSGDRLDVHLSRQASGKVLRHRWTGRRLMSAGASRR